MRRSVHLAIITTLLICVGALSFVSCFHPVEAVYYMQQNKNPGVEVDRPVIDWGNGGDGSDGGDSGGNGSNGGGETDPLPEPGKVSIFTILRPDGFVNTELLEGAPEETLQEIQQRLPQVSEFSSTEIRDEKVIRSKFSSENVPILWYVDGSWNSTDSSRGEFINSGPNTDAGGSTIHSVAYYSYTQLNPFYGPNSTYNTVGFDKTDETKMDRFVFYRFTGKTAMPALDNFLVAVDTHTKLFFAFAKPIAFETVFGQQVPRQWAPVDEVSTDSSGKKRRFYEYDPAGYVNDQGNFVRNNWYTQNLAKGNYDPVYTGKSPYTLRVLTNSVEVVPKISATRLEDGVLSEADRYYTDITIHTQPEDVTYNLYRQDDRSSQWVLLEENLLIPANQPYVYRDYNALMLYNLPMYRVEAFGFETEAELPIEALAEGSRMLNFREIAIGAMNSIRLSIKEIWYAAGSASGKLKSDFAEGNTGTYYHGIDRNSFLGSQFWGTNYRRYQGYMDFSNSLFTLDGTFLKDKGTGVIGYDIEGVWTHQGSQAPYWPQAGEFPPRTDFLTVTFGTEVFTLTFDNLKVGNNDKNNPQWDSGTVSITDSKGNKRTLGKSSNIPISFFMDDATFDGIMADYQQLAE